MQSQYLTIFGLVADIVGAFLLAVEAIKVPNILVLRDKFIARFGEEIKSPPLIFVEGDAVTLAPERDGRIFGNRHPYIFMVLHYVAGAALILLVDFISRNWLFDASWHIIVAISRWSWYFAVPTLLISGIYFFVAVLWLVGECVHLGLTKVVSWIASFLNYIESNTENGTIGIIGFALLFLGFALQIAGTIFGIR